MRLLTATILCLLACAAGYGTLAYFVNPQGDFATSYFTPVVLPDREAKLRLFETFLKQSPPTGLILGSSRSLKLKPSKLEKAFGGRYFNFAVTGATVEDYSGVYNWVRSHGVKPAQVVIGLDIEALHAGNQYTSLLNVPELRAAFEDRHLSARERISEMLARAKNVYRFGYLTDLVHALVLKWRPTPLRWSFDPDGYVRYRLAEQQRADGTFDYPRVLEESAVRYQILYKGMPGLSPRRKGYLESLILRAQGDGARVTIWITPVHPNALHTVENGTQYARLVEETSVYLASLRARYHVGIADLHDPNTYGAGATYWYDCVHYDDDAADHIIAAIAGRR